MSHPPDDDPSARPPAEVIARLKDLERKRRELATLVIHDLRNPLSAILGHLELLRGELDGQGRPIPAAVADLESLAQSALGMLATLLDVEELEEGLLVADRQPVDVADYFTTLTGPYQARAASRHLKMTSEVSTGVTASFDRILISRVLENLLDNATRYANRRGRVDIRVERREDALEIRIGNDGPAVPDEERAQIFERYYRLEARRAAARENRGLGLYFCKLAVAAHGGTISIETTADLPATFVVVLPQV